MKKFILLVACVLSFEYASSCSDYDPEYEYYNLFMQELISDPQYYPFLLTYEPGYYTASDSTVVKNENIEEWQHQLGITYDQAYYLVYKASRTNLQNLIQGKKITDPKLEFANGVFAAKHMQALRYLSYAKYLEPYMTIHSNNTDSWNYRPDVTVANLKYNNVISTLEKSWAAEGDKELKLRYGYQLVRFAHYNREFKSAINYFNKYVEALKFKPAIYYYALDQKAGAEAGLQQYGAANYDFFVVFSRSKNLKESAFQSIRFSKKTDYNDLQLHQRLMKVLDWREGHRLADAVEQAKIAASQSDLAAPIALDWLEDGLPAAISPEVLQEQLQVLLQQVVECAQDCVRLAGVAQPDAIYLTGGSSALRTLREALKVAFPSTPQVEGDLFGGVATGLAYA